MQMWIRVLIYDEQVRKGRCYCTSDEGIPECKASSSSDEYTSSNHSTGLYMYGRTKGGDEREGMIYDDWDIDDEWVESADLT
jgi:hypothetical protein